MASGEQENELSGASKGNGGKTLKIGAAVRVPKLDNLRAILREGGTLYSEARRREGRFPNAQTAQRLANILGQVRESISLDDMCAQIREEVLKQVRDEMRKGGEHG